MRIVREDRIRFALVGAAFAAATFALAGSASAAGGGIKEQKGKNTPAPSAGGSAELGQAEEIGVSATERQRGGKKEGGAEAEEGEKALSVSVDLVLGFGKTDVVDTSGAPPGTGIPAENTIDARKYTSLSFLVGAGFEVAKGLEIGARLPFAGGQFSVPGGDDRGSFAVGNIELEAAYRYELNDRLALEFALGVALPTAQGSEIPESAEEIPTIGTGITQSAYDRFAIQKAAQASRGFEENALFEPSHLGLIPKIALEYHQDKLKLTPWTKLENLVATDSALKNKYVGEWLLGANVSYLATPGFEPTLRLWTNIPVANADFKAVVVAEPQLKFHAGDFTPVVGVILPVAGTSLTDPYAVGVRAGVAAAF